MIEVTTGSAYDVAAIMPVMEDAFDPAFGEAWTAAQCLGTLSLPGTALLIAASEGQISGFALSRWVGDEEELLLIGVTKTERRRGVGRRLIGELINKARESRRSVLFLEVRDGNEARKFYNDIGFLPVGRRADYYRAKDGNRYDSVTMALNLQSC
jgi:[ribosomal protein S18]-alanine N-acetyltransferase